MVEDAKTHSAFFSFFFFNLEELGYQSYYTFDSYLLDTFFCCCFKQ